MCCRSFTCWPVATKVNFANFTCRSHPTTASNALLQRQLRSWRSSTFTSCLGKVECRSHECRRRFQALSANDKRCAQATRCGKPDKISLQEATAYTTKQLCQRPHPASIACAESFCKDGAGYDRRSFPLPYPGVARNAARFVTEWQEVEQTHLAKRIVHATIHCQSRNHTTT